MTTQSMAFDNLQAEYDTLAENAVVLADEVRALHDEAVRLRRELVLADDENRNLVRRQADANAALERQVRRALKTEAEADRWHTAWDRDCARLVKLVPELAHLRCQLAEIEDECECDGAPDARTNQHGDAIGPFVCMYHRVNQEATT